MEYKNYLIIDLEATCCDRRSIPREETETIEIGAVMADGTTLGVVDEFSTFVRPVRHPTLTSFCTKLTSITQHQVNDAPSFENALNALVEWIAPYPDQLFCSWGDYDRIQLQRECCDNRVVYPLGSEHLNLKQTFSDRQELRKRYGMARALRLAGLELHGTHHRGIDDARNMAKLLPFIVGGKRIRG